MKTTLDHNTIETFQRQPAWKHYLNVIVDICKRHFDKNLLGFTESTNTLKRIDENTDLQPNYPSLSYKNDLMRMNLIEGLSIRSLMRILTIYGCKLLDVETNVTIPHTYKVQGQNRGGDLWGFQPTNRTYDYEANSITNVPELDNTEDSNTDYFFPSISENYFEEDKTFKYIYDIYGYNQKEPMLCYSAIYEIKTFHRLVTPDTPAMQGMAIYVLADDIIDEEANTFKVGAIIYQKSGSMFYQFNAKANDFTLAEGVDSEEGILAVPVFYLINDNDKIDLLDSEGVIRYNSDDDDVKEYENLRGISPNRTNDVFKITLTYAGFKLNDYKVYLLNIYPNKYVVANEAKTNLNNLNPYYAKNTIFGSDSLIKTQPIFLYHYKDNGEYIDTASLAYNGWNVKGGENLPSYQFLSFPYKTKDIINEEEVEVPIVKADYGNLYNRCIANEVGEGCVNNIEARIPDENNQDGQYVEIDDETLREISSPDVSLGNKFNTCIVYSVKQDADGEFKPSLMIGKFYYIGNLIEGEKVHIFNEYTVFDISNGYNKDSYVVKGYKNNSYYIGDEYDEGSEVDEFNYILEDLRKQEYVETMYFNHFVKIYPITKTQSDSLVETNMVYCDNLDLVQYGNTIPYMVTTLRKGELDEDEKFMDLDCSVFSKIVAYNKHTHLVTLNNEICFPNSYEPIYAVVAYQNLFPFTQPKRLRILTPNNGVKDIVQPLTEEMFSDRVSLEFYSQKEYDEMLFWEKHNRQKIVNNNNINTLLQELDNKAKNSYNNYAIYGLLTQKLEGNQTITLEYEDGAFGTKTAIIDGYLFYFNKSDLIDAENHQYYYNYAYITLKGEGAKYISCVRISADFKHLMTGGVSATGIFKNCTNLRVVAGYSPIRNVRNDAFPEDILYLNTSPNFEVNESYFDYYKGLKNIYNINLDNVNFINDKIDFSYAFQNCENMETLSLNFKKKVYATSISHWLEGCKSLRYLDLSNIDFSLCTDTDSAFEGCSHLERIIVNWGNNNVITTMQKMFKDCRNLKSIGDFSGWYGTDIDMESAFENCEALNEVMLKNIKGDWSTNVSLFKNCGAETIGFYAKPYPSGDLIKFEMPNLKNIEYCGEVFDLHSDSTDIKVWIDTPNLTRESFMRFMSKQFTQSDDWVDYGFNVYVHPDVINRLIIGTDIEPDVVDKDDIVICYNLLKHNSSKVKIYPTKENVALGLTISTNVAKKSPYKAGIESIENLTLTMKMVKRKYPIKKLYVYANNLLIDTLEENEVANGGTFTHSFSNITETTELKAIGVDSMDIYVESNKIKYTFTYPFYSGILTASSPDDITSQGVSGLNEDYYQNRRVVFNMSSGKIPIFAFPKELAPEGLKGVVDYNAGHNSEDMTQYWHVKELTINNVEYLVYYTFDRMVGWYYFVLE